MNKNQLTKIRDDINKLKRDLGPQKTQLLLYGLGTLIVLLILIVAHRPVAIKLGAAQREFNSLQAKLLSERAKVTAFTKLDLEGRLMQQTEVSQAIDEITEKGRSLNLKFVSITPKELQKETGGNFRVLPISLQIECAYTSLGQFLAYIEEFPRTIAEVRSLSIHPRENILPKLNVELLVYLYMEG